jgi:hypothetical protein
MLIFSPAVASTLFFGTKLFLGFFDPQGAAYTQLGPNSYQNQINAGTPNPGQVGLDFPFAIISTPQQTVIDANLAFLTSSEVPQYLASVYQNILNHPSIANSGRSRCLNYKDILDPNTQNPGYIKGTVRAYASFLPPPGGATYYVFTNAPGYAATLQAVDCGSTPPSAPALPGGLALRTCASLVADPPSSAPSVCPIVPSTR